MTNSSNSRRPDRTWLAWHAAAILLLVAIVGLRYGLPPWRFTSHELLRAAAVSLGYLLGAAVLHARSGRIPSAGLGPSIIGALAGFAPILFVVVVTAMQFSRFAIVGTVAAGIVVLVVGFNLSRGRPILIGAMVAAAVAMIWWTAASGIALTGQRSSRVSQELNTGLYQLELTVHRNSMPRSNSPMTGGGIEAVDAGQLIATGDGFLIDVQWDGSGNPVFKRLPGRVPMNRDPFVRAAGAGPHAEFFRVLDVLFYREAGRTRILVSHHRWKEAERCFVVQVSMVEGQSTETLEQLASKEWATVFETAPCLPLVPAKAAWPFRGVESGGRMLLLGQDRVLLTVGDQGFNGIDFPGQPNHTQDPKTSYGKSIVVDVVRHTGELYTIGHRNPQGLSRDSAGQIWSTEHGPQGGDELNLLRSGANYGWPSVTYGTEYGKFTWHDNPHPGRHDGFEEPSFVWSPSLGISNLIALRGALFPEWKGDLLISSLNGRTLFRIRLGGTQVRLAEPIRVGDRVRDLVEANDGRIIVLTDNYALAVIEPAKAGFGLCAGCHSMTGEGGAIIGPDLRGVMGRQVALQADFTYSDALRKLGGTWTEDRLDKFLTDPQGFAPGTAMSFDGIQDPQTRRRVIDYLKSH